MNTSSASGQRADHLKKVYFNSTLQILGALQEMPWPEGAPSGKGLGSGERATEAAEIWKRALEWSKDDYLGINAGSNLPQQAKGHLLVALAANSATAGEALKNFCQYHQVCSDAPHPGLEIQGGRLTIALTETDGIDNMDVLRHMCECLFVAIVRILGAVCSKKIHPTAVHFAWRSPGNTAFFESVFNAPVKFESRSTCLEFDTEALEAEIPFADEVLLASLEQYADSQLTAIRESGLWSGKVQEILRGSDLSSSVDVTMVASRLLVSPRTLQQRLRTEGTSYQNIVRDVKMARAKALLTGKATPLSEIALALGYSEQSAFNHAFKTWTGLSPNQYRRSKLQPDS